MPHHRRRKSRAHRHAKRSLQRRFGGGRFVRLIIYHTWFRLAAIGLFCLFLAIGMLIPKVWTVSPQGTNPLVKVSLLNLIQAWRLKHNAKRATAGHRYRRADFLWRAAIRKNLADVESFRGALTNALRANHLDRSWLNSGLWYGGRLLMLTRTNTRDLNLVTAFLDAERLDRTLLDLLLPLGDRLSPRQERTCLKALFRERRMREFLDQWSHGSEAARNDPETKLYHEAYLAGWGDPDAQVEGNNALLEAVKDKALAPSARRLQLQVYAQRGDVQRYGETLRRLRGKGQDRHKDHAIYWKLLTATKQGNVAKHLATDYWSSVIESPPRFLAELIALADAYATVDLAPRATGLLESHEDEYQDEPEYWVAFGRILIQQKAWETAKMLAQKIREGASRTDELQAYSYYMEGRIEAGQGQKFNAGRAFTIAVTNHAFHSPGLALEVSQGMLAAGFPYQASAVLAPFQSALEREPKYWEVMFSAAFELKQSDQILVAGRRLLELNPRSLPGMNNYAAALIVRREKPEEAIRYTWQLYSAHPNVLGFALNHGLALVQNGRFKEAEAILGRINPGMIDPRLAVSWSLGLFELYMDSNRFDQARKVLATIDLSQLFPEQNAWLETQRALLLAAVSDKG